MIWFCNVITTDLCEKSNPKKSLNNGQKCRKPVCGFPAFVLSNGSSLALFVDGIMTFINQYIALLG